MRLDLQNLKVNHDLSEETICFSAELFVNGFKTAYAVNRGNGGATFFTPYQGMRPWLEAAEKWAKTQPPLLFKQDDHENLIPMDLELYISLLIESTQ